MPEFLYSARNTEGKRFAGSLEAPDQATALQLLSERFALVTRLEKKAATRRFRPLFGGAVSGEDLLTFSQTMAAMLEGGISIKRALEMIYLDAENVVLRTVAMDLSQKIGKGEALSAALSTHPQIFNPFFVKMVKAGEESGELPEMLERVAAYIERMEALADKVKSALTYPTVVLLFAFLMVMALLAFGIPYLRELYDGLGIVLPAPTRLAVAVGGFLGDNILFLVLLLLGSLYGLRAALSTAAGRLQIDKLKLSAPLLGSFFRVLYTARFARTLALLYTGGIPLLTALKLTGESVGNEVVAKATGDSQEAIEKGLNLSDALRANPYFLDAAIGMIAAGEESGKLDQMLTKVADFYEHKVQVRLEALTSTIEPLIMIAVGLVIALLILTLGLPFMTLATNL